MLFDAARFMDIEQYGHSDEKVAELQAWAERFHAHSPMLAANYEQNKLDGRIGKPLTDLIGAWGGEQVLVVGAGRTAQNNIDLIRRLAPFFKIVAVDKIHGLLKENGITPDMTITIDRRAHEAGYLSRIDEKDCVAICVTEPPEAIDHVLKSAGSVYFFSHLNPFDDVEIKIYNDNPRLAMFLPGTVVGFSAMQLGYWMVNATEQGGGYIVMVGNELGWFTMEEFEKDRAAYNGGEPRQLLRVKVDGSGKVMLTIWHFMLAVSAFAGGLEVFKDAYIVDASMGLAEMKYEMPLEEAALMSALRHRPNFDEILAKATAQHRIPAEPETEGAISDESINVVAL